MNKVDTEYFRIVNDILTNGKVKKNRTGIDTIGIFGAQAKYDVDLNAFPILTTKKVHWTAIVHELLWFISGDTNIKYLVDNNVKIWNEWAFSRYQKVKPTLGGIMLVDELLFTNQEKRVLASKLEPEDVDVVDSIKKSIQEKQNKFIDRIKNDAEFANRWGELGYGTYGSTWTAFEVPNIPVNINPHIKEKEPAYDYSINSPKTFHTGVLKDDFCGKNIATKKSGTLTVIGREPNDMHGRPVYIVQFDKTGYTTIARKDAILNNRVGDPFYPSRAGVGFIGNYKIASELDENLYKVWSHMLDRCYNPECKEYEFYGNKGVFVCNRWLSFERFIADVKNLPNWRDKKLNPKNYQLDKDYYHSNCYSADTCVWLKSDENKKYQKKNQNQSRIPLPINQLQKVIDKLKTNPDDRRIIVSAWHPYWVDHCALPPCHCLFQFHTEELTLEERIEILQKQVGPVNLPKSEMWVIQKLAEENIPSRRLNCLLYQRSQDTALGNPFNVASYSLLTAMIAQTVNMTTGTFTHSTGDTHIYVNHLDGLKLQLTREPKKLPKLWLNPEVKSLFDFKYDDIKLLDYEFHPTIKFEVAV